MPEVYSYAFNDTIKLSSSYGRSDLPPTVEIRGSFQVDYSLFRDSVGFLIPADIYVNNTKLDNVLVRELNFSSATAKYNVFAYQPDTPDNINRSINLYYNDMKPEAFVSARYDERSVDSASNSGIPFEASYVSQEVATVVSPICFSTGTLIRTARGEEAVEDLIVGDLALTASGTLRTITWIGNRDLDGLGKALPRDQQPVRIRAGAFGPGIPARDLRLSHGHPVLVGADVDGAGGALVPIMCLINGTTIARIPVETVTYWHVELDSHDILLAEGLPVESYIDGGDRAFFTEASDHPLHNPDFVAPGWGGRCRPVAVDGAIVEAERLRLDAVFAGALSAQGHWTSVNAPE